MEGEVVRRVPRIFPPLEGLWGIRPVPDEGRVRTR